MSHTGWCGWRRSPCVPSRRVASSREHGQLCCARRLLPLWDQAEHDDEGLRLRSVVCNARANDVDLHLLAALFLEGRTHRFDHLATRTNNGAWCRGVNRERHDLSLIALDIHLSDGGVGIAFLNKGA